MYMIGCQPKMRRIMIKDALLKDFDMTERGFRKKFRYSRPERSETFIQFSSRLCSYLNKWLTMAKVEKSFEAVCDFMAREQFLLSVAWPTGVQLLVFFCSSVPVVLFDTPGISRCRSQLISVESSSLLHHSIYL